MDPVLDEADYLADTVAILHAPGKLLAIDNPVTMKHRLGKGYNISINGTTGVDHQVVQSIRRFMPDSTTQESHGRSRITTGTTDLTTIRRALSEMAKSEVVSRSTYHINGATLEEVFLDLNRQSGDEDAGSLSSRSDPINTGSAPTLTPKGVDEPPGEKDLESLPVDRPETRPLHLTAGHKPSYLLAIPVDAWTIVRKRLVILRRAWLLPLIAVIIAIAAACIPLFFLKDRNQTCELVIDEGRLQTLTYPKSYYPFVYTTPLLSPASVFQNLTFGTRAPDLVPSNQSFVDQFAANITNNTFGGISLALPPTTEQSLFAWEGSFLTNKGPSLLNLLNNILFDSVDPPSSTADSFRITLNFQYFPSPDFGSTAQAFKWIAFFGLGLAVWPAFAVIYPTVERATNVRSNQYSNGASPVSLWLGHILFELPPILLVSTVITIVFSVATSQFSAPGDLWICLVLYGIASTLYAYLFALFLDSALAAWALVAGINVILFLLYL